MPAMFNTNVHDECCSKSSCWKLTT